MIGRIKNKFNKAWFNYRCTGIFDTPVVNCDPSSNIVIVSQLYHPDVAMYMLAMKSFARFVRPHSFVVVDDGLLAQDRATLLNHFDSIRFVPREAVPLNGCPAGGCWERLLTLSEENKAGYAIQLDADTLTLREPTEVIACASQNRTFTLGTKTGQQTAGLDVASRFAHERLSQHVQNHAERALVKYPGQEHLRYVRGCAGFTGFGQGNLPLNTIAEFSGHMSQLVGAEKWREWGSEQVASNFMAANAPEVLVLPVDRYPFWGPEVEIGKAVLVHFFGTFRYTEGMYTQQALQIIRQLSQ